MVDRNLIAIKETIDEVLRLKQLNFELLETLQLTMLWFKDYHDKTGIPIPSVEVFGSLMRKANQLIDEICSPPKTQHQNLAIRRKKTDWKYDVKDTEPSRDTSDRTEVLSNKTLICTRFRSLPL